MSEQKRCPRCGETKSVSDFYANRATADGRQVYCKRCINAALKPTQARRRQATRRRRQQYINDRKAAPCADCGQQYPPRVMHFDHVGGDKAGDVSRLLRAGASLARIQEEIDKCELRCANCHTIRHMKDNEWC